eukprot:TRINITY_DN1711_c0_g1_i7.p1 TRINITY_DN1711_c0_g1~~TRINITY_DN1711_c0_g1_i7.p1  ORF type:complete len:185 (+),score=27.94 TRINITY_DN1711_c0_g1_i7:61-555(+)
MCIRDRCSGARNSSLKQVTEVVNDPLVRQADSDAVTKSRLSTLSLRDCAVAVSPSPVADCRTLHGTTLLRKCFLSDSSTFGPFSRSSFLNLFFTWVRVRVGKRFAIIEKSLPKISRPLKNFRVSSGFHFSVWFRVLNELDVTRCPFWSTTRTAEPSPKAGGSSS